VIHTSKARALQRIARTLCVAALLSACTQSPDGDRIGASDTPSRNAASAVSLMPPTLVESRRDGTCLAREIIPAVYEQVMGEVQVVQAEIAPDGTVLRPPVYRKAPVPRIVQPRGEFTFDAVCGHQMTPEFVASLQRALAARNYFGGNVTGSMDAPTMAAVRWYQGDRGLDSAQLSLETARTLGLIAVDLTEG